MTFQITNFRSSMKFGKILQYSVAVGLIIFNFLSMKAVAADFEGSLNSVSITDAAGSNLPPVASFIYSQDGDSFIFDASGSYDSDGSITDYLWDFGDGGLGATGAAATAILSPGEYPVTLTITDNAGGVSITQITLNNSVAAAVDYSINFQPASATVPTGFSIDSGSTYDSNKGYGWQIGPNEIGARDRDNSISPDQSYDTMIHVSPESAWEIGLPNGSYSVAVCAGDASYPYDIQNIQAEGVPVIDNKKLSWDHRWAEDTKVVTVSDGRLTLTFKGSDQTARLCWVKITSVN